MIKEPLKVGNLHAQPFKPGQAGAAAADGVAHFQGLAASHGAVGGRRIAQGIDGEGRPVGDGGVGKAQRPVAFQAGDDLEGAAGPERGDRPAPVADLADHAEPPDGERDAHRERQPFAAEPENERQRRERQRRRADPQAEEQHQQTDAQEPPGAGGEHGERFHGRLAAVAEERSADASNSGRGYATRLVPFTGLSAPEPTRSGRAPRRRRACPRPPPPAG